MKSLHTVQKMKMQEFPISIGFEGSMYHMYVLLEQHNHGLDQDTRNQYITCR